MFGVIPVLILYVFSIIKTRSHPQFIEGITIITALLSFFILDILFGSFGFLDKKKAPSIGQESFSRERKSS